LPDGVLIVGGGLAGVRTAQGLRDGGYAGRLTIVSDESENPYDRPPLSKAFLSGDVDETEIRLLAEVDYERLGIELELDAHATALDTEERCVELADGRRLVYSSLVIASGARPRRLPNAELAGVLYLRSADDSRRLRRALLTKPRLVIVGGGFIGLEVAAVAATLGCSVTVIEELAAPLARILGPELGDVLREWHEGHGVAFRCSTRVSGVSGRDGVERVLLSDGSSEAADVVLIGIGIEPCVEWLATSGLDLHPSVACDAGGRTASADVWAVGDAACWHLDDTCGRTEHWSAANEHAQRVAAAISGAAAHDGPVESYFWSDQYDARLQFAGAVTPGQRPELVSGGVADRRFLATFGDDGVITAAFAMSSPREFLQARRAVRQAALQV
jgi:3-phenylpropionate/trans-cinnamate dioxygenase ferredoxin reductase subunit